MHKSCLQSTSDLMGLIQIMIMTFAEVPPVYSKPRNSGNSPAHYPTPYPSQPPSMLQYMLKFQVKPNIHDNQ